ncbi:hypothetical protein [Oricola sp.]|uniref:hypothetical protein n=1 Tax=Oricola sp. TaxID=1979950 RepID=UPI0025D7263B|nr:hypothetical protein [Oricola sp.]MCI5075033.1 hypothetical protein [Oricola sp.]
MIYGTDTTMFLFLLFIGVAGAYFVGVAMDGVLREDGFGVLLNAVILIAGGFLGLYVSESLRLPFGDGTSQAVLIVSGAFLSLAFLAALKAVGSRMGF